MPAITMSIPSEPLSEYSTQISQEEKTRPRASSETPSTADQSQSTGGSPSVTTPIPEKKADSPFIEKYEMGSGKNRINVRIFKEPPSQPEPAKLEPKNETKQVNTDTLVLRLKRDFTATPTRPRPSKQALLLEE